MCGSNGKKKNNNSLSFQTENLLFTSKLERHDTLIGKRDSLTRDGTDISEHHMENYKMNRK